MITRWPISPGTLTVLGMMVFLFVMAFPISSEARHLKVYSPSGAEQGETELSYWTDYFIDTDLAESGDLKRGGLWRHSFELEYGVTDKWRIAYYADFEHQTEGDDVFTYVQSRFETIYRLWDPGERLVDVGLYFEYEIPRSSFEEHDELELKVLLEKSLQDVMVRFNPVFAKEIDSSNGFEVGYETGVYYTALHTVALGVEAFGDFGQIRSISDLQEQNHSIGPTAIFHLGHFAWDVGFQFGVTDESDDVTLKSIIAFEF